MQPTPPVESGIATISALFSALAVIVGAVITFMVMRVQRDMARLKADILDGINGKYISRKEHDILEREQEKQCASVNEQFEKIDSRITETRSRHHELHEQFIKCQASHAGAGHHET